MKATPASHSPWYTDIAAFVSTRVCTLEVPAWVNPQRFEYRARSDSTRSRTRGGKAKVPPLDIRQRLDARPSPGKVFGFVERSHLSSKPSVGIAVERRIRAIRFLDAVSTLRDQGNVHVVLLFREKNRKSIEETHLGRVATHCLNRRSFVRADFDPRPLVDKDGVRRKLLCGVWEMSKYAR